MSIIQVPTPEESPTVPLSLAVTALGYSTHQKAFHEVRKGTFPVATSKEGTRVRVSTAELRKALKLGKGVTKFTAPAPAAKQVRKAPEKATATPAKATTTKATAAKEPATKATAAKATAPKANAGARKAPTPARKSRTAKSA